MTGRTWEIRFVREGGLVTPDEEFSSFAGDHHAAHRVGMAVREIEFTPEERAEIARIGDQIIHESEGGEHD